MEGNCSEDESGDEGCQDSCTCFCCCSASCGCNEQHSDGSNFSAQMAMIKEIWEEWSEVQQMLALFTLLKSGNGPNNSAYLMVANMLYAHHNNDETFQLFQEANDPVWVARMEMKCMEEAGLEADDDDCDRSDSDRRESASSGERRESGASSSYRRESGASSFCRRESASSWDRRESTASSCRRESECCDERLEVESREWRRESRSEEITEETEDVEFKESQDIGPNNISKETVTGLTRAKLTPDFGSRRESEVTGEERRESTCSSTADRRGSAGSNHSGFDDRRDSSESFLCRRMKLGNYKPDAHSAWQPEHCDACEAGEQCITDEKLECFAAESSLFETLDDLLLHLPLVHVNNVEAKRVFLSVIERVTCIALRMNMTGITQKVFQLTTYALLHPGVTASERKRLTACLQSLRDAPNRENDECNEKAMSGETEVPMEGTREVIVGPPLIKDIGIWLKSLRLHKYDWLVSGLDYHQLLSLDDETLEAKGVTKGARHKLLQSIARLSLRHELLNTIEKELQQGGVFGVEAAIAQLKTLVITPMPPPPPAAATASTVEDPIFSQTAEGVPAGPPVGAPLPSAMGGAFPSGGYAPAAAAMGPLPASSGAHHQVATAGSASSGVRAAESEAASNPDAGAAANGAALGTGTENEDLPTHFTRVLGKVVSAVAVACNSMPFTATWYHSGRSSSALLIASLLWLLDKCLQHESFAAHHKRLWMWRNQLILPSARCRAQQHSTSAVPDQRSGNRRWSQQMETQIYTQQLQQQLLLQQQLQQQLVPGSSSWGPSVGALGLLSFPYVNQGHSGMRLFRPPTMMPPLGGLPTTWGHSSAPHTRPGAPPAAPVNSSAPTAGCSLLSPQPFLAKRPSLQEPPCQLRPHVSLQRTRSAPSRPHQPLARPVSPSGPSPNAGLQPSPPQPTAPHEAPQDDDITNRLESLCLSVTQHALE
ncbi:uncharacterized protein LOC108674767 [Hyalella azteca]|uniref:Uncharacterized protein LOC108674767 n=1 Tax=Hyalella azteca TaxID=294128 RepID=A0A8B7NWY0_HYAAZ|nr:uncharacterized protein LOC108674767 [Hyalella azteca]